MSTDPALVISSSMIRRHLANLTVAWFNDRELPPADVADYAPMVAWVRNSAERAGDTPWFVLGLQHILHNPALSPAEFGNDRFSYTDTQMREIIGYVLQQMGAKDAPPALLARVNLADIDREQWQALRGTQSLKQSLKPSL